MRAWMKQGMASEPNVIAANISAAYPKYLTFGPGVYVSLKFLLKITLSRGVFAELPLKIIGKVQMLGDYYAIRSSSHFELQPERLTEPPAPSCQPSSRLLLA